MQVVHSDIKSGNVLLNEDASIAKIADVGTSRILDKTCTTGTMMCTFSYAAPEQMFGLREACNEKVLAAAQQHKEMLSAYFMATDMYASYSRALSGLC